MDMDGNRHRQRRNLVRGLLIAVAVGLATAGRTTEQPSPTAGAVLLTIDGAIGPATAGYVQRGLRTAVEDKAAVIVLRMDTPGGLDTAMRDIVRGILASPIPVLGFVSPSGARAASAGTYILYACHLAAMAPGTNLGAATPVKIGGIGSGKNSNKEEDKSSEKTEPGDPNARKAINDAVAYIRSLAVLRGHNADWAESAVRDAESLSATEALDRDVIDFTAIDLTDLLNKADGRTVRLAGREQVLKTRGLPVTSLDANWREQTLAIITNPNIAYILMLAGIYGLIFEFLSPGAIAPGVVGTILLLIGLYALNLLPINFAGGGLIGVGIALMIAEAFLPSFGIVGVGGIVAFLVGSLLLFDTQEPGFALSWTVVGLATAATAIFILIALSAAWRAHRRSAVTGDSALLGLSGRVLSWQGNEGDIRLNGERWHARSNNVLTPGQSVRVLARDNLTLFVEPETPALPPT